MKTKFENGVLVLSVSSDMETDSMSIGMLTNNDIDGIAKMSFSRLDDTMIFRYNLEGFMPLRTMLGGVVDLADLIKVITKVCDVLSSVDGYMLDDSLFILDEEHIFIDKACNNVRLICLPVFGEDMKYKNFGEMIKAILFSCQFNYGNSNESFGIMVNYLNSESDFNPAAFKKLLSGKVSSVEPKPATPAKQNPEAPVREVNESASHVDRIPNVPQRQNVAEEKKASSEKNPSSEKKATEKPFSALSIPKKEEGKTEKKKMGLFGKKEEKSKKNSTEKSNGYAPGFAIPGKDVSITESTQTSNNASANSKPVRTNVQSVYVPPTTVAGNFGETTVLNATTIGETTVLDAASNAYGPQGWLLRVKTGEKVAVDKPLYRIGKEKSYVDYFIADNPAVSRAHANIRTEGGRFFIIDTNSTNHTFVNGKMILPNEEKEIMDKDKIRLGNEEFEFLVQ